MRDAMATQNTSKNILKIENESDIVAVRKSARTTANSMGFSVTDVTRIVTAASELARNIYRFAGRGIVALSIQELGSKKGLVMVFEDNGPGIADIHQAMIEGFTTAGGLGLGLPGTKRLMDEMDIQTEIGGGTKVTVVKWLDNGV